MNNRPIEPNEFSRRMAEIVEKHRHDGETATSQAAARLMAETLVSIGYGAGIEKMKG